MPKTEKYYVGPRLLGEIRETITRVAGTYDKTSGVSLPVRLQDLPRRGGPPSVRFCSWTSTWYLNTPATITFHVSGGETATATNSFFGVGPAEGWVARDGNSNWRLICCNLSQMPGFDLTQIQLLGHDSEVLPCETECSSVSRAQVLHWYTVTNCGTATSSP